MLPVIDPSLMDANPKFPYFTEDSSRLENLMDRNRQRADRVAGIVTTDVVIKNLEMEALIKLLNQTFPHAFDEIGMYW